MRAYWPSPSDLQGEAEYDEAKYDTLRSRIKDEVIKFTFVDAQTKPFYPSAECNAGSTMTGFIAAA